MTNEYGSATIDLDWPALCPDGRRYYTLFGVCSEVTGGVELRPWFFIGDEDHHAYVALRPEDVRTMVPSLTPVAPADEAVFDFTSWHVMRTQWAHAAGPGDAS